MAQRDALLRLHKLLLKRRVDLRKQLEGELTSLCEFEAANCTGDRADRAFETSHAALSSQLAVLDAGQLQQIDGALGRLQLGIYRICEGDSANCQKSISAARLKALPDTTLCINCERELERHSGRPPVTRDWDQVFTVQASTEDFERAELESKLIGNRRASRWRQLSHRNRNPKGKG